MEARVRASAALAAAICLFLVSAPMGAESGQKDPRAELAALLGAALERDEAYRASRNAASAGLAAELAPLEGDTLYWSISAYAGASYAPVTQGFSVPASLGLTLRPGTPLHFLAEEIRSVRAARQAAADYLNGQTARAYIAAALAFRRDSALLAGIERRLSREATSSARRGQKEEEARAALAKADLETARERIFRDVSRSRESAVQLWGEAIPDTSLIEATLEALLARPYRDSPRTIQAREEARLAGIRSEKEKRQATPFSLSAELGASYNILSPSSLAFSLGASFSFSPTAPSLRAGLKAGTELAVALLAKAEAAAREESAAIRSLELDLQSLRREYASVQAARQAADTLAQIALERLEAGAVARNDYTEALNTLEGRETVLVETRYRLLSMMLELAARRGDLSQLVREAAVSAAGGAR